MTCLGLSTPLRVTYPPTLLSLATLSNLTSAVPEDTPSTLRARTNILRHSYLTGVLVLDNLILQVRILPRLLQVPTCHKVTPRHLLNSILVLTIR